MRPYPLYVLISISLFVFSCKEKAEEKPVTREEALALAKKIDSAVANKKSYYFVTLIHERVFADRTAKLLEQEVNANFIDKVRKGLLRSDIAQQINSRLSEENGSFELLRHYEKDNVQHLLYRLYGSQGLNYQDFELIKVDGEVYIADVFVYVSGENLSKSLADGYGQVNVKLEDFHALSRIQKLLSEQRYEDAKNAYDNLPANLKNRKTVQIVYLAVCAGLDKQAYAEALNAFETKYRDEPFMELSLLDGYFLREEFNKALDVVDKLDSMLGRDPFLDYFRYNIYTKMNKRPEALQAIENVHKAMPQFMSGYLELIATYLEDGEYEKARPLVESYRSNKKFNQDLLEEHLELYPGFEPQH
jgi:hypothetical protein